jgi:hypothetical protein
MALRDRIGCASRAPFKSGYDVANPVVQLRNISRSVGNPISAFYLSDPVGNGLCVTDGSGNTTLYGARFLLCSNKRTI